jgi:mRNA interferase MazF
LAEASRHRRLELTRGDVVVSAAPGDFGKPRPALVVQSDLFNPTHASIVICPITSHLIDAPLFRLTMRPSRENGLKAESQIMVDKMTAISRDRIGKRIGRLMDAELAQVDRALSLWLGIAAQG